jgi:hypothetical protein
MGTSGISSVRFRRENLRFEDLHIGSTLLSATGRETVGLLVEPFAGEGVVLGGVVHRPRVLREGTLSTVRRASTGASVNVSDGLYVGCVLPSIDWAYEDATPRTVLNRNVRPLLAALRAARVQASYLGRDVVSVVDDRRALRAAFVLGFDVLPDGRLLIEAIGSARSDLAIPASSATDLELGTKRFAGKETLRLEALGEMVDLAERVAAGLATVLELHRLVVRPMVELDPAPPEPQRSPLAPPREVPIGWLELLEDEAGALALGGDLLVARYALEQAATGEVPGDAPIDGASWADVTELLRRVDRRAVRMSPEDPR